MTFSRTFAEQTAVLNRFKSGADLERIARLRVDKSVNARLNVRYHVIRRYRPDDSQQNQNVNKNHRNAAEEKLGTVNRTDRQGHAEIGLSGEQADAVAALVMLGLPQNVAESKVKQGAENGAGTVEELIKFALKK